jgi:ATP-dependent DNA helicase RecQ
MEQPLLLEAPKKKAAPKPSVDRDSWEGVDRRLFERLRVLRRELAKQRSVPAYIVFTDSTLRDLARKRPLTSDDLLRLGHGMKLEQWRRTSSEIRDCG